MVLVALTELSSELAGLQTAGAGVLGSISAPLPPIAAPGDLAAPMGELQPVGGGAGGSSGGGGGGGWLSWITGSGTVQKAEPQVRSICHALLQDSRAVAGSFLYHGPRLYPFTL